VARDGLYHRAFAWLLAHGDAADRRLYAARKTALLGGLRGHVLDIGAGAGVNLPYLDPGVRYTAVEPNPHFHRRIRQRGRRAGIDAEVIAAVAEDLPLADASVDAVIATLVLCSVDSQQAALAEIRRVLRPGGTFAFIEHVAAPAGTALLAAQRALRTPWGLLADGCRPDRRTGEAIADAGFAEVHIERFEVPGGLVGPHVMGRALAH
jgi:SAM-dependent methyltransferase